MRRFDPFDRKAMALSLALHTVLLAVAWFAARARVPEFEFIAYEIELVSPPPAAQAEEPEPVTEDLVVETPEPEPLPPEPEEELPAPIEEPEPEPEPEPEATPDPPPVEEEETPATTEEPVEDEPEESGEDLNVRLEGLRRDYPAYYANIIRQINRCFRPPGGRWETTVAFTIAREGSVSDIEFLSRSGNPGFDFEAMGAVECAGQGRLGPLPEDLPFDEFRVSFTFSPAGDDVQPLPIVIRGDR